jgi:hypothetical protein
LEMDTGGGWSTACYRTHRCVVLCFLASILYQRHEAASVGGLFVFASLASFFLHRNHCAADVSLYAAHFNLCRVHESWRNTPAVALGIADRVWTIADLIDAALATRPITPTTTAPDWRSRGLWPAHSDCLYWRCGDGTTKHHQALSEGTP